MVGLERGEGNRAHIIESGRGTVWNEERGQPERLESLGRAVQVR